ncbi:MAG: hypothetical protein HGB06_06000 [Chlorobaculum sp.]|jgi:hypothetical protein|nr:hypothetical protein [Chlorobaculum sp.]
MAQKVSAAVQAEKQSRTPEQRANMVQLLTKIADLEERGFIKRQEFKSPTTADFEREMAYVKKGVL